MITMLLEPKDTLIDDQVFILSKFPAVQGREIITKYPLSGIPKLGDYQVNEEIMLKLMAYVAIRTSAGTEQRLLTIDVINNHIKSWETLVKVEWAMMEYNCSFFQNGRISNFFADIAQKLPEWITKILTTLSESSLAKEKPHSMNSEPSTH